MTSYRQEFCHSSSSLLEQQNKEATGKQWKVKFINPNLVDVENYKSNTCTTSSNTFDDYHPTIDVGKIIVQGRTITPSEILPKRFYTPLKYELKHILPLGYIKLPSSSNHKIKVSIKLVDYLSGNEITDSPFSEDGKGIKGSLDEFLSTRFDSTIYSTTTKFQLTDITYRHDRHHTKPFAFLVSYFLCDEQGNTIDSLLVKQSSGFQSLSKKRKRYIQEEREQEKQERQNETRNITSSSCSSSFPIVKTFSLDNRQPFEYQEESNNPVKRYKTASQQQEIVYTLVDFI